MPQRRTYRYVVRAAQQMENQAVIIHHHSQKHAIAEFRRRNPKYVDKDVVCRRYTAADGISDQMNEELQEQY